MNPRRRIMGVTLGFAFCFTVVSCKLIWIQLVKQESYREQAIRAHTRGEPVPAQRGSILDVSGRVLAQSLGSKFVWMERFWPSVRRSCLNWLRFWEFPPSG